MKRCVPLASEVCQCCVGRGVCFERERSQSCATGKRSLPVLGWVSSCATGKRSLPVLSVGNFKLDR